MRRRVLLGVVSLTLVPIYLFYFSPLLDSFVVAVPSWVRWLGNAVLATGVALFTWSHSALGRSWSVGVEIADDQRLVTSGPYRWVRHPMYSSLLVMAVGLLLATANPIVALPYLGAIAATYIERVGDEERLMLRAFGDDYARYMATTGRLLPRWRVGRDA